MSLLFLLLFFGGWGLWLVIWLVVEKNLTTKQKKDVIYFHFKVLKMYNLIYKNVKLNSKPMTLSEAKSNQSSIIINYGYRPTIVPIKKID